MFKDLLLLLHDLTYLPLPRRARAGWERRPKAMRYLPLLGLLAGAIMFWTARLAVVMPQSGAAALLVGMNLLVGGAFLLRDLITVADGLTPWRGQRPEQERAFPDSDQPLSSNEQEMQAKERRFNAGKAGMVWGLVWLLGLFLAYYSLCRAAAPRSLALLAAPVTARWLMSWLIFYFPAFPPATLHSGFSRRDFVISSCLALLALLPMSRLALYVSVLVAFLGIYLFASARQRSVGALDENCYGAAAAWGELLFLLAWLACSRLL